MRNKNGSRPVPLAPLEASFHVSGHVVRVSRVADGRWSFGVDGAALSGCFRTQADAWEAGVREADRLDRPTPPTS